MDSELDIMANKLRNAREQNSNTRLKNLSSSALELYDNRKVSSLEELCRSSCEVAFAVIISQSNASPNNEVQGKLVEVETIMAEINKFARIVASRNFIASLFLHRWDAAKIQEYRSSLKKYITDKDFRPNVPVNICENLTLSGRRSRPVSGNGQTFNRQSFTPPPTRNLKKPVISTNPVNSAGVHFNPISPLCRHSNASAPAIATPTSAKVTSVRVWQYNYFGSVSETNLTQGSGNKINHRNSHSFNTGHYYQEDVEFEEIQ
ncbi:hypothetical protein WG66_001046 [Moniliophthora roreri]|uniref:Uncharacterized protein n=1 Tax=Moniliophthora roreri TaxID=221103 RepID=A0A0W0FJC1_MONRR|nr:hypothetical protein WG66_001046 [Moniliophthora roreri]